MVNRIGCCRIHDVGAGPRARPSALALILALLLAASACSPATRREPVTPIIIDEDDEPEKDWSISRDDYEATIKQGLQKVMRWYFVKPAYKGSAFVGYQVVQIYNERLEKGPLRIGDVLMSINGLPVERPEHALAIWRGLWGKKRLKIALIRDGKKKVYDIPIVQ